MKARNRVRSLSSLRRPANAHVLSGCAWECARLRPHARFSRRRRFPMTTTVQTQSDYRDLPLDWLVISPTNPRKTFDEDAMQELAASIRENGVLQPLLVPPRAERSFEIVFGERRYRGAAMDVDAISATVKQEFAAKDKGKASKKATAKSASKPAKRAAA